MFRNVTEHGDPDYENEEFISCNIRLFKNISMFGFHNIRLSLTNSNLPCEQINTNEGL